MLDTVCEQIKNNRNGFSIRQSENDTTGVYWTNEHLGDWMYSLHRAMNRMDEENILKSEIMELSLGTHRTKFCKKIHSKIV